MKVFILLCCILLCITAHAQYHQVIVTVSGDHPMPVNGATIALGTHPIGLTDTTGRYIFRNVASGPFEVSVSLKGYRTVARTGILKNHNQSLIIRLHPESHLLQEVIVKNISTANRKTESLLQMDIVRADFIKTPYIL